MRIKIKKYLKKGQSSTEFVILIGFMMMMLLVFFIVIQQKIVEANEEKNELASKGIMDIVINEIRLAESVSDDYYREFYLPIELNGLNYNISIMPGVASTTEVVLKYENKEKVYFLEQFVNDTSTVGLGSNNITKSNGVIYIRKMT
jgi:hypothetical protein